MATVDLDYLVIGAGSGGVRSARIAASLGARVAIIEAGRFGGTCVNVGCVPKKLFVYAAEYSAAFRDAAGFGWDQATPAFSWTELMTAKDQEIARLNAVYRRILTAAGVTIIEGRAKVTGPHTVTVGDATYSAAHILVATGSRPFVPTLPGAEHIMTSDDMFALPSLPASMVIVGAGYIGVEFAGILQGLGVDTTLVYRSDHVLGGFDRDVRATLASEMAQRGVALRPQTTVERIDKRASGELVLTLQDHTQLTTEAVLYATGRLPNTQGLGLQAAGVELTARGGVVVDDNYRTSVPSISAVGDVIEHLTLTPVALAQGTAVAHHLFGTASRRVDTTNVPTAVFSQPPVATIGLTEAQARDAYPHIDVYRSAFRPMRHTLSGRAEQTMMKLLVNRDTDRVVGLHMVGADAGEIAQGFAVAFTCGATKAQFDATIGIHPSAAEEFVTMRTPQPEPT